MSEASYAKKQSCRAFSREDDFFNSPFPSSTRVVFSQIRKKPGRRGTDDCLLTELLDRLTDLIWNLLRNLLGVLLGTDYVRIAYLKDLAKTYIYFYLL